MHYHGRAAKILVLEPDRAILEMLEVRLDVAGYHPIGVRNGEQALDLLRNTQPDAMMVELNLPGMDAIEVMSVTNSRPDRLTIPALLMGRELSAETVKRAMRYGVGACLAKPFSGADALERLGRVLKAPRPARPVQLRC